MIKHLFRIDKLYLCILKFDKNDHYTTPIRFGGGRT